MEAEVKSTDCKFLESTFPNVWSMTSREFHTDPAARADLIASHLKDNVTMQIFEEAIRFNRHLFKGKTILVLNAGIDLCFSLWAVKYGAAHVYAVDNSKAVDYIKAIVERNNMCGKITVLKGRTQDIELPVEKVDLILSNWMGYALLIEDKIRSVLYARDKWLKKAGIIFPDCADLLIAGVQNSSNKNQRIDWWRDVYSFNMNAIRKKVSIEPTFQKIESKEVLTMPVKIWSINLKKITREELCFQRSFYIEITNGGYLEGLLSYFDVRFSKSHVPVQFSTSPWAPHTKWLQTVLYFDEPLSVNVGEKYHGGLKMKNSLLNDGTFATKTYLELYSGLRSNLSLIFKRNWICKWFYVDHTDGVEDASSSSNSNGSYTNVKKFLKLPKDNQVNISNLKKSQQLVAAKNSTILKNPKPDWSLDTIKKELSVAVKIPCKIDSQFPNLSDIKRINNNSTKSKTYCIIAKNCHSKKINSNDVSYLNQPESKEVYCDFEISQQTTESLLNEKTFCVTKEFEKKIQINSHTTTYCNKSKSNALNSHLIAFQNSNANTKSYKSKTKSTNPIAAVKSSTTPNTVEPETSKGSQKAKQKRKYNKLSIV